MAIFILKILQGNRREIHLYLLSERITGRMV